MILIDWMADGCVEVVVDLVKARIAEIETAGNHLVDEVVRLSVDPLTTCEAMICKCILVTSANYIAKVS